MQAVFKSARSEVFALARFGAALSYIEVSRADLDALIGPIEQETGFRHDKQNRECMANGVLVRCLDSQNLRTPQ